MEQEHKERVKVSIHPKYWPEPEKPILKYTGLRENMIGGEYLGGYSQFELFKDGDIITATHGQYWFDPAMLIKGRHFVRVEREEWVISESKHIKLSFWVLLNTKEKS